MNNSTIIYLRKEENINEYRTPLTPKDVNILIQNKFIIYVQSSEYRVYKDNEYSENGAIITNLDWYDKSFNGALIVGIKEMKNLDKLNNHKHIYFSHSYKNQTGSDILLKSFYNSLSTIYDFEFFLTENKRRIIAFGFYAGIVGCVLGLLQFYKKFNNLPNINNLIPWNSFQNMIDQINFIKNMNLNIGIIGHNGRCGTGVKKILNTFELKYTPIERNLNENDILNLKEFDIFFNCITLDEKYNLVWFDKDTNFNKNIVIVDISCDYNKMNNPIKLYSNLTSWNDPVYQYNKYVDIIAISNLPSLLPKESSDEFSSIFKDLLLDYINDSEKYWNDNLNVYLSKIEKFSLGKK
jgi:saccharopine dehydrogenase (NAD+, L-lysine-forming)